MALKKKILLKQKPFETKAKKLFTRKLNSLCLTCLQLRKIVIRKSYLTSPDLAIFLTYKQSLTSATKKIMTDKCK